MAILTTGLAIWLSLVEKRAWLRQLGWIALTAVIVESVLGFRSAPLSPAVNCSHDFLAQLIFSTFVTVGVLTSRSWKQGPELVEEHGRLRSLAIVTVALVVVQVALGAAFRQGVIGATPHIMGALIVLLLILVVGMLARQNFAGHRLLYPAATALMGISFLQAFLGFTVLTLGSLTDDPLPVMLAIAAHVATGALTLAATVVFAILIRRSVRPTLASRSSPSDAQSNCQ